MPIRVLHIVSVMNRGGIETFLMNLYRNIDREKVQFDFLYNREEVGVFEEEIEKLGGRVYKIPHMSCIGYTKHRRLFDQFLKEHSEYKIVHCHMNTWCGLYLPIAKKNKVTTRIAHSHTSRIDQGFDFKTTFKRVVKLYHKNFIKPSSNFNFACSHEAAVYLYGKNYNKNEVKIIANAIDLKKFAFNVSKRNEVRKALNIDDNMVSLVHVGRFGREKNHEFLIKISYLLKEQGINFRLYLIGEGQEQKIIQEDINRLGLGEEVIIMGAREDVDILLNGFDIFVLPSHYEGLGIALVEAQVSGLQCLASDTIPKEVDLEQGLIEWLTIKDPQPWVDKIIDINKTNNFRVEVNNEIKKEFVKYNIDNVVDKLESFYIDRG